MVLGESRERTFKRAEVPGDTMIGEYSLGSGFVRLEEGIRFHC